nr:fad-dependent monooxygenase mdpd [Quercus suber]
MNHTDVVRSEPNGVSVLIAGAGVGGLVSALECWRRGCEIRIFERTAASVTSGDHFAVGPSGATFFQHWPELSKKNSEIAYYPLLAFHKHTGERIAGPIPFEAAMIGDIDGKRPPTVYRHSRPRFHQMLLAQLSKLGVEVEYGKEVIDYYEDLEQKKGGVVTKDGSKHQADVVIAADGVRGNSWPLIAGGPIPARSSGDAIFRVAYPAKYAVADPVVAERFKAKDEKQSIMELWTGYVSSLLIRAT